jgi:tripartite-type tricarboxylate transporter receptor subunit TctC
MTRTARLAIALAACLASGAALAQGAANFPNRPLKIVVPFTPGGGNDVFARAVGVKMSERMGQPVIVENKPGAGGNIGTEFVAKSPADGYTMVVAQNGLTMSPWLQKVQPFDVVKDFAPVGIAATLPMVVVVNPALPVRTIGELVAYAKAQPGKLSYATPGIGSPHHLSTELFMDMTGTKMIQVPYKGAAGMLPDLMSGQVQVMFGALNSALPLIQSGKIRALGVGERQRLPYLSDVPTVNESLPGYEMTFWFGLLAPVGTPEPIVRKLNEEMRAALASPDVVERLKAVGFDVTPGSPEQMAETIRTDMEKWGRVVKAAGIKPE